MDISTDRFDWSLNKKIDHALGAIEQFYVAMDGKVYISFSGGKDSTVMRYLIRMLYPNTPLVFVNTGLEFPEIQKFVKDQENVITLYPKMGFKEVVSKYGIPYPSKEVAQKLYEIRTTKSDILLNKRLNGDYKGNGRLPFCWRRLIDAPYSFSHLCCDKLKKQPIKKFERETGLHPFIGTMASESGLRKTTYLRTGCNILEGKRPQGRPLSIWNDKDIWEFIRKYKLPYSEIYDMGYSRTGCMFCLFGINREEGENRIQKLKMSHPKQYDFIINSLGFGEFLEYEDIPYK